MLRIALFSWVLVLLVAAPAAADVVMSPPTDCPPGAAGATCHSGPFCALVGTRVFLSLVAGEACAPDGTCGAFKVCRTYGVRTAPGTCGGGRPLPDGGPNNNPVTLVTGSCAIGSADCTTSRVCEPVGPPPAGNCTASDGAGRSVVAVAVLAAAALLGGRRRARGSRASRRLERSEVRWSATNSE